MADQKAGPMGVEWGLQARALLAAIHHGWLCLDQAEMHADIVGKALAAAYAAGRENGLEEAARWVRLGRWHDPDSCAAGIRALAAQPPPALAQPSATRKEE